MSADIELQYAHERQRRHKADDKKEMAEIVQGVADSYRDYVTKQLRRAWERADLIERRARILKAELEDVGNALKSGAIDPDTARRDMEAAGILPVVRVEEEPSN